MLVTSHGDIAQQQKRTGLTHPEARPLRKLQAAFSKGGSSRKIAVVDGACREVVQQDGRSDQVAGTPGEAKPLQEMGFRFVYLALPGEGAAEVAQAERQPPSIVE